MLLMWRSPISGWLNVHAYKKKESNIARIGFYSFSQLTYQHWLSLGCARQIYRGTSLIYELSIKYWYCDISDNLQSGADLYQLWKVNDTTAITQGFTIIEAKHSIIFPSSLNFISGQLNRYEIIINVSITNWSILTNLNDTPGLLKWRMKMCLFAS